MCIGAIVNPTLDPSKNPTGQLPDEDQWQFEGVYLDRDGNQHGRHGNDLEFLQVLQKFLILHRNHGIHVLHYNAREAFERVGESHRPIDPEEVLSEPVILADMANDVDEWWIKLTGKPFSAR
jgi:hypothetical protein